MLSGYKEWAEKRGQSAKVNPVPRRANTVKQPTTVKSIEAIPTGGVLSYNQMKRINSGGARPPSEVGSIRSFRSVQTVEEQVGKLENQVQELAEAQQQMETKIDQILSLLSGSQEKKD